MFCHSVGLNQVCEYRESGYYEATFDLAKPINATTLTSLESEFVSRIRINDR